jgi:hypothetical protein
MDDTSTAGNGGYAEETAERLHGLREEFEEVDRRLRDLVQERPLTCLLAALLGGYAVARLVRR